MAGASKTCQMVRPMVKYEQSLEVTKAMICVLMSDIVYFRFHNDLPENSFHKRHFDPSAADFNYESFMENNTGRPMSSRNGEVRHITAHNLTLMLLARKKDKRVDRLLRVIETGVFQSLDRKTLKSLTFIVRQCQDGSLRINYRATATTLAQDENIMDERDEVAEIWSFNFRYPEIGGPRLSLARDVGQAVIANPDSQQEPEEMKKSMITTLRKIHSVIMDHPLAGPLSLDVCLVSDDTSTAKLPPGYREVFNYLRPSNAGDAAQWHIGAGHHMMHVDWFLKPYYRTQKEMLSERVQGNRTTISPSHVAHSRSHLRLTRFSQGNHTSLDVCSAAHVHAEGPHSVPRSMRSDANHGRVLSDVTGACATQETEERRGIEEMAPSRERQNRGLDDTQALSSVEATSMRRPCGSSLALISDLELSLSTVKQIECSSAHNAADGNTCSVMDTYLRRTGTQPLCQKRRALTLIYRQGYPERDVDFKMIINCNRNEANEVRRELRDDGFIRPSPGHKTAKGLRGARPYRAVISDNQTRRLLRLIFNPITRVRRFFRVPRDVAANDWNSDEDDIYGAGHQVADGDAALLHYSILGRLAFGVVVTSFDQLGFGPGVDNSRTKEEAGPKAKAGKKSAKITHSNTQGTGSRQPPGPEPSQSPDTAARLTGLHLRARRSSLHAVQSPSRKRGLASGLDSDEGRSDKRVKKTT
ncbi:MAG: DNA binding protein [Claussenomyces sp. TS43310]|nr:MAG: DNA binding protein [Claussenomyces sp. TS43310]